MMLGLMLKKHSNPYIHSTTVLCDHIITAKIRAIERTRKLASLAIIQVSVSDYLKLRCAPVHLLCALRAGLIKNEAAVCNFLSPAIATRTRQRLVSLRNILFITLLVRETLEPTQGYSSSGG